MGQWVEKLTPDTLTADVGIMVNPEDIDTTMNTKTDKSPITFSEAKDLLGNFAFFFGMNLPTSMCYHQCISLLS